MRTHYSTSSDVPSRQLRKVEWRKIHKGIKLQPYDTEVHLSFYLGASYWEMLSDDDRRAVGREFSRLVALGEFPEIDRVARVSPRRYYRI